MFYVAVDVYVREFHYWDNGDKTMCNFILFVAMMLVFCFTLLCAVPFFSHSHKYCCFLMLGELFYISSFFCLMPLKRYKCRYQINTNVSVTFIDVKNVFCCCASHFLFLCGIRASFNGLALLPSYRPI